MGEENGIVALEELPEKEIYLEINPASINKIGISERILSHWLSDSTLIRLDVFNRIVNFLFVDYENIEILSIRGKIGGKIENPKLPFNFATKSGARFVACMLGDGSLNKRGVFYSNTNLDLIEGFIKDCKEIFGNIKISINHIKKKKSIVHVVSLPIFCKNMVNKLGLPIGPKVVNNPHIPNFIFNLDKEEIAELLSQIIDDEGSISMSSRHLGMRLATEITNDTFNLLEDIRKLLLILDIESVAYKESEYTSKRGPNRVLWKLEVHSFERLEKLYSLLNLRNKEKAKKFKKLLDSKKLTQFPHKKCTEIYLSKMREIEKERGFFTSTDLLEKIDRKLGHIRNMIHKYWKKKLIQKVENVTSDGTKFYPAKYRVIK